MARTSRVTLDRQQDASNPPQGPGATQAGMPEEQVQVSSANDKPTLDEIAEEAYAIYLANGSQDGFDIDHWLEAERRIITKRRAGARQDVVADDADDRT